MTSEELDLCGKGAPARRIFLECRHDPARGECACEDDGEVTHHGTTAEIGDWYFWRDRWPVRR